MTYLPNEDGRLVATGIFVLFVVTCLIFFRGKKDVSIYSRGLLALVTIVLMGTAYMEKAEQLLPIPKQAGHVSAEIRIDMTAIVAFALIGIGLLLWKAGDGRDPKSNATTVNGYELTTLGLAFLATFCFGFSVNVTRFIEMTSGGYLGTILALIFWASTVALMIWVIVRLFSSRRTPQA